MRPFDSACDMVALDHAAIGPPASNLECSDGFVGNLMWLTPQEEYAFGAGDRS